MPSPTVEPAPGDVLVVGALDTSTALSGVRALSTDGWRVHAVGSLGRHRPLTGFSRWVRSVHPAPSPATDAEGFARAVAAAVQGLEAPVLLAAGDAELLALASSRDLLPPLPGVPDPAALHQVLDKRSLHDAAAAVGLAVPVLVDGAPRAWPVVVKAALHSVPGAPQERWEVELAHDAAQLAVLRERAAAAGMPLVVQERVAGPLMAVALVVDAEGRAISRVQQLATTTFPVGAGRTGRARTVAVDDELAKRCARLLAEAGWVGMAQLQFLLPPSGPPVLIDANPRLYGSVALAVAAGAPLPQLAARVLRGEQVAVCPDARAGVRYQWLEGDLKAALAGRRRLASLVRAAAHRGGTGPLWSARDPLPALVSTGRLLSRVVTRRRQAD